MDDVRERSLERPDGRVVAWTEFGPLTGRPLLRLPGTPSCRWAVSGDRTTWADRDLRVLTTERPGFGASSPFAGTDFATHADDLLAVLDAAGIEAAHAFTASGGAPFLLALCERAPRRVRAATVASGSAPVDDTERSAMIGVNARASAHAASGDRAAMVALLAPLRDAVLADPVAAFRAALASAPAADQEVMADPAWQAGFTRAVVEALRGGVDGWVDEAMLLGGDWSSVRPERVTTSVTWFHAAGDRNAPLTAAERLVARLGDATFTRWPEELGHLHHVRAEADLLDELLARG